MQVYATAIQSDIALPLELPENGEVRQHVELSAAIPAHLKKSITCGFPFFQSHGRHIFLYSDREFDGSAMGQPWCYEVQDVVRFYWLGGERKIYYAIGRHGDAGLLAFWFVHLLLPFYFTLEGVYDFLHAGAVEVEGKPILFIAPSMGGKSTMTEYFINKGHALISDDKVSTYIDGHTFMVAGSHPYYRPYRKFEELGHRVDNFITGCKPIHGFYVLRKGVADAEIAVDTVKGFAKFELLLPNYFYMFSYLKPERLQYLAGMLSTIRMFVVHVPWDTGRLAEVHAVICAHSKELQ